MNDPFTETVVGTERIAMLLQNVPSVFDTERYRPTIQAIRQSSSPNGPPSLLKIESERLIADHLRALYVLVADGAPPPGKNGRERIMKLIIRGMITRQILLGIEMKNFLAILHIVLETFEVAQRNFPEKLTAYFVNEAKRFQYTIERGYIELEKLLKQNKGKTLSGQQMVFLEKRCGIPFCLIALSLQNRSLTVQQDDYKKALIHWKHNLVNNLSH